MEKTTAKSPKQHDANQTFFIRHPADIKFFGIRVVKKNKLFDIHSNEYMCLVPRVLVQGTVFARMSPDQKAHLVEELQTQGLLFP